MPRRSSPPPPESKFPLQVFLSPTHHEEPRDGSSPVTAGFNELRMVTPSECKVQHSLTPGERMPESIAMLKDVLKYKMRRGSTWLDSQRLAARHQTYVQGAVLEPCPVDDRAVSLMQRMENMPQSPPTSYGSSGVEEAGIFSPLARREEQRAPFMGVVSDAKKPRIQVSIGGELVRMVPTSVVAFAGMGESWRLDPPFLEPSLAGPIRPKLPGSSQAGGTYSLSSGHHVQGQSRRLLPAGIGAVKRTRALSCSPTTLEGSERYGNDDSRGFSAQAESRCNLVGGSTPSLQRDGFRSRAGQKLDNFAKLSGDKSVRTHGSYRELTMVSPSTEHARVLQASAFRASPTIPLHPLGSHFALIEGHLG